MRDRLSLMQGAAQQFLRLNQPEHVRSMVANISSELGLVSFIVVSPKGQVIASNSFIEVGWDWQSLLIQPDAVLVQEVLKGRSISTTFGDNNTQLDGYSSLCMTSEKQLGKQDCGFIFYRINMRYHYVKATQALQSQAIFIVAGVIASVIGLLVLVDLLITSRIERLVVVLKHYAKGDRGIRSNLRGHDELGAMGRTIDTMLATLEADEKLIMEKEERLETLFQAVADPIITIDQHGLITHANKATERLFGYRVVELMGQNISILMPESGAQGHDEQLSEYKGKEQSFVVGVSQDLMGRKKDGRIFPIEMTVTEMRQHGECMFTGIIRDITERKQLEANLLSVNEKLKISAHTDSLTGLANRRKFDLAVVDELNRATRSATPLSLLMCDIDYFKNYNDSFGHQAGDDCLQQIAGVMRELFTRSGDLPCRYGGEEFAIILADVPPEEAKNMAELLLKKIAQLSIKSAEASPYGIVTASIGYATYQPCSVVPLSTEAFINKADEALYKAKEAGRNRVEGGPISVQMSVNKSTSTEPV